MKDIFYATLAASAIALTVGYLMYATYSLVTAP